MLIVGCIVLGVLLVLATVNVHQDKKYSPFNESWREMVDDYKKANPSTYMHTGYVRNISHSPLNHSYSSKQFIDLINRIEGQDVETIYAGLIREKI